MDLQIRDPVLNSNLAVAMCVLVLIVVGGCEQKVKRVAVSGKVLLDGEPIAKGTIRFVPASGRPSSSRILQDGSFRVSEKSLSEDKAEVIGLFPGNYRIAVSATEYLSEAEDAEARWLVPRHYGDFRTSGLEADIQAPNESMIVELTWEGAEETDTELEAEAGAEDALNKEEDQEPREIPNSDA